jgi:hypothetical protein
VSTGAKPWYGILDHFSKLNDPHQSWLVVYSLPEILLVVLCGTLTDMDGFMETAMWREKRLDFMRRFLPSHDRLKVVPHRLDWELAGRRARHYRHRRQDLPARAPRAGRGYRERGPSRCAIGGAGSEPDLAAS